MKRRLQLTLCLALVVATLSACSGQPNETFPMVTQQVGPAATATAAPTAAPTAVPEESGSDTTSSEGQSIFSANPYDVGADGFSVDDALGEENQSDPNELAGLYYSDPNATLYPYAGSSPIPLDPIDMPSPTPRPELNFTYTAYTAASLGLTFEAPVGWQADETQGGLYILSEPSVQMKDNQLAVLTISAEPVNSDYSQRELEKHVSQRLDMIGGASFDSWKPSYTATRHLMGTLGVYANYSGRLKNGTEVGGRVHYVCIDRMLYGVEIVFPLGFKGDFLDVFTKVRETIKRN